MSEQDGLLSSRANASYSATAGPHSGAAEAATVTFNSVRYSLLIRRGPPCCFPPERKEILLGVSGVFQPGMNAVLGPTGSGKSSLLDVIAGRKNPQNLTGTILINGEPPPKNFKCVSGYVVQEDVVMGTLTVRENLLFSAALRLPASVSRYDRGRRVAELLDQLGLTGVADSRIGTQLTRGVSGGERRRTSIGMELIASPKVLFLDEPTTGLDASTANSVMRILRNISRRGTTIIFSIHQPRYEIFKTFDSLTLLSKGQIVYHGDSVTSLDYFQRLGYVCEMHNNPLDFYMDILSGDARPTEVDSAAAKVNFDHQDSVQGWLVATYQGSEVWRDVNARIAPVLEAFSNRQMRGYRPQSTANNPTYQTSFFRQLAVVSQRATKNLLRNPQTSIAQLVLNVLFSVLVGLIYLQIPADTISGVQNRVGVFFFTTMNMVFGNMGALELFLHERTIFVHESVSGYYRVSVYFLAKVFCDLIPMRLVPLMLYSPISYFMIGLNPRLDKFFVYFLNLLLVSMAGSSLAFFLSATVSVFAIATIFLALSFVFMMVFAGLLVNVSTMGEWLSWAKYLSIFRYSMNALSINEMKDLQFCNETANICFDLGNKYLSDQGIPYENEIDLWINEIALGGFIFGFLVLAYVQLRRSGKFR
ncbi:hypothetical protein BOX15_Mlig016278g1 [Macrostomum lignano]|uniref:ABC transporter domain-containing protein n=1 Tax=Macrostomum lignano TaxID=282301 RepID=A0A267ENF3_9PLAT|nr:hypothetical protein BOX15_Mlig016278g1 [Macrostomum lignano]